MKQLNIIKCIEGYEINNYNSIDTLPIIYRQNQGLKYLVKEFDLVIDKGIIYAFNKLTGLIEIVFSAIRSYEVKPELTCKLMSDKVTKDYLLNKIKGD